MRWALRTRAKALKREALTLWIAARDPRTPVAAKLLAGAIAAYAFSPIDFIPDFIPVLGLLDDVVIVREAELRETLVRLALEEHLIAEGAGALALAAGRRVAGKRKCAVVSGGNIDALALAALLSEVRPRPPRKPRRRGGEAAAGSRSDAAEPALAKKVAVAKRRPTATLAPSSSISAPLAPPAPQHVSEEEFTW